MRTTTTTDIQTEHVTLCVHATTGQKCCMSHILANNSKDIYTYEAVAMCTYKSQATGRGMAKSTSLLNMYIPVTPLTRGEWRERRKEGVPFSEVLNLSPLLLDISLVPCIGCFKGHGHVPRPHPLREKRSISWASGLKKRHKNQISRIACMIRTRTSLVMQTKYCY